MPVISKSKSRPLTLRQKEGRAVNAVAELLRKRLSVPNIYLEPRSPAVDVLAVDRAGSGDLHGVEIRLGHDLGRGAVRASVFNGRIEEMCRQLMSLPAHYKYLAVPRGAWDYLVFEGLKPVVYSPDGIGRVGIIAITDQGEELPSAEIVIVPERFRVDATKLSRIEKNLINNKKVRPDIEVRI